MRSRYHRDAVFQVADIFPVLVSEIIEVALREKAALGLQLHIVDLLAQGFQRLAKIRSRLIHLFLESLFAFGYAGLKRKLQAPPNAPQPPAAGKNSACSSGYHSDKPD